MWCQVSTPLSRWAGWHILPFCRRWQWNPICPPPPHQIVRRLSRTCGFTDNRGEFPPGRTSHVVAQPKSFGRSPCCKCPPVVFFHLKSRHTLTHTHPSAFVARLVEGASIFAKLFWFWVAAQSCCDLYKSLEKSGRHKMGNWEDARGGSSRI